MQKKDCFLLGTVFKLHGYKGDIKIYNDNDIIFDFNSIHYLLIEQENTLVPFFIKKASRTKPNIILIKFEDINSENEALKILKRKIYLPIEFLPKIKKNQISEKEIIGFKVLDINLGDLGEISYVNSQTPQQLIYVNKDGKEFCFPMHKNFIMNIDEEKKIIKVSISKDLIDLN